MNCSSFDYAALVVKLDVGAVFLLGAILKGVDPRRSEGLIAASFGRHAGLATPLLLAEGGTGIALLLGFGVPFAVLSAIVLACGFTVFSLSSRLSEPSSGCRCFGSLDGATPRWFASCRALLLLGASVALLPLSSAACLSLAPIDSPPEVWMGSALGLVVLAAMHAVALRVAALVPGLRVVRPRGGTQ